MNQAFRAPVNFMAEWGFEPGSYTQQEASSQWLPRQTHTCPKLASSFITCLFLLLSFFYSSFPVHSPIHSQIPPSSFLNSQFILSAFFHSSSFPVLSFTSSSALPNHYSQFILNSVYKQKFSMPESSIVMERTNQLQILSILVYRLKLSFLFPHLH